MSVFSDMELLAMRRDFEALMSDSCQVGSYYTAAGTTGELVPSYRYGITIACGFQPLIGTQRAEYRTLDGQVVQADARCRLAHDTPISERDRVRITHRHGQAVEAVDYEVMGAPALSPAGMLVYLRAVAP